MRDLEGTEAEKHTDHNLQQVKKIPLGMLSLRDNAMPCQMTWEQRGNFSAHELPAWEPGSSHLYWLPMVGGQEPPSPHPTNVQLEQGQVTPASMEQNHPLFIPPNNSHCSTAGFLPGTGHSLPSEFPDPYLFCRYSRTRLLYTFLHNLDLQIPSHILLRLENGKEAQILVKQQANYQSQIAELAGTFKSQKINCSVENRKTYGYD